ncbi:MAG: hypothetical protein KHX42_04180, partial [Prevotella sp.]|nr:hypothetical protein [Prevotella sp.]
RFINPRPPHITQGGPALVLLMSVYVSLFKELFLHPPQGVSLKSGCKSNNFYPNMQDFYTTFFNFYSIFLKELTKVKRGHGRTHYYIREVCGENTGERKRGGGRGRRIMTGGSMLNHAAKGTGLSRGYY